MGLCTSQPAPTTEEVPTGDDRSTLNCVLVGSAGVGKTCVCEQKINKNDFTREYSPSKGMDIYSMAADHREVRIFVSAGTQRVTIGTAYFKSASCFILMYDVCDQKSFRECKNQLNLVTRHGPATRPPIFMIGNKIDEYADPVWQSQAEWKPPGLDEGPENVDLGAMEAMERTKPTGRSRQVNLTDAQDFCDEHGIQLLEMSAATGEGVDQFFDTLIKNCENHK